MGQFIPGSATKLQEIIWECTASRILMTSKCTIRCSSQNWAWLVVELSFQANISGNSLVSFEHNDFLLSKLVKATMRNMIMLMQNLVRYILRGKVIILCHYLVTVN